MRVQNVQMKGGKESLANTLEALGQMDGAAGSTTAEVEA